MDSTGIAFLDIIFFAMVAGFLILRLRSVLGRRSGDENAERWRLRKPDPATPPAPLPDNVARFPDRRAETEPAAAPPAPGSVEAGIAAIQAEDGNFDPTQFRDGARAAFEMIVAAFAQGDAGALRPLLADGVYHSFATAIRERQAHRHVLSTTLIGIRSADLVDARLEGREAQVTVKFVSEQVNATTDATGAVVEGDPNRVETVTDIWTFARNTRARDPNWFLVRTDTPQ